MENKYIKKQEQEVFENSGKKLPVIFCIDVSQSMRKIIDGTGKPTGETFESDGKEWTVVDGGTSIADVAMECLKDFNEQMKKEVLTRTTCQTAYVTFGDKASKIEDFGLVQGKDVPLDKLKFEDDDTKIVDALYMCLDMFNEQKKLMREYGVECCVPWLIILTDGEAHDFGVRIKEIQEELQMRQRNNKLVVYVIALSEDEEMKKQLTGYSTEAPISYEEGGKNLVKFFKYLKASVSQISSGKTQSRIPGFNDFKDIR